MPEFPERFAERAADTDYSRYPQLQVASKYDISAAAEALRLTALRLGTAVNGYTMLDGLTLGEPTVVTVLLAQEKRWDDKDELVSVEFEEYWDATDTHKFSSGLLEQMKDELTRGFLAAKKTEYVVVSNPYGIWLFNRGALEGVFA